MKIRVVLAFDCNNMLHNTKYMFEYLNQIEDYEIKYIINNNDLKEKLIQKYGNKFIGTKTKEDRKYIKNADVWLLDGGMPIKNIFYMRKKLIINLWHGIPIKKVGIYCYRFSLKKIGLIFQQLLFRPFVTAYITSSSKLIEIMSKSFLVPKKKILILGQPRNDFLLIKQSKNLLFQKYKNLKYDLNTKIVLYAPTWRNSKYGTSMHNETKYFPFDDINYNDFNEFLKENNIIFFLRPHPLETLNLQDYSNIKILGVDICSNINDILNLFDLLITDYSSIFIDYLLLNLPIILLPYDLEYYKQAKGLNFEFDDVNPGPNIINYSNFKIELIKLLLDNSYYEERRKYLNDMFNEIKSNSAQKIEQYIRENIKCKK